MGLLDNISSSSGYLKNISWSRMPLARKIEQQRGGDAKVPLDLLSSDASSRTDYLKFDEYF